MTNLELIENTTVKEAKKIFNKYIEYSYSEIKFDFCSNKCDRLLNGTCEENNLCNFSAIELLDYLIRMEAEE